MTTVVVKTQSVTNFYRTSVMDARCRDPLNALSRPRSCGQSWSWVPVVQAFADRRRSKRRHRQPAAERKAVGQSSGSGGWRTYTWMQSWKTNAVSNDNMWSRNCDVETTTELSICSHQKLPGGSRKLLGTARNQSEYQVFLVSISMNIWRRRYALWNFF